VTGFAKCAPVQTGVNRGVIPLPCRVVVVPTVAPARRESVPDKGVWDGSPGGSRRGQVISAFLALVVFRVGIVIILVLAVTLAGGVITQLRLGPGTADNRLGPEVDGAGVQ